MKKRIVSIVAVVAMLAGIATSVFAQTGIPGSGWWTGEVVQNVGTATANLVVTAYDKNGASTYSSSTTVAAGASTGFIPSAFAGMPTGFIGSAVVSSDQPIKAVVNVSNVFNGTFGVVGGKAQALYQGAENTATAVYFPMVKHNRFGKSTVFYIQNAGASAATATAVFAMDTGGTYTYTTPSIGANKMVVVNPIDAGVPSTAGGGGRDNIGSLKVTSAQPLAGTVLEYKQGEAIATVLNGTRGFTSADFDSKAYAPIIKNARFGRFTGIQVQNATAGSINVTVRFVGAAGVCAGNTYTDTFLAVPAGKSHTFNQTGVQTNLPANCTASATVIGTGNIIATVNEENLTGFPAAGITSSAAANSSKTTKISVPQFKDRRFGATTGLMIENVGTSTATNIVSTFSCKGGAVFTAISVARSAPVGGAIQWFKPANSPALFTGGNPFSAFNVICGVTITSDQPIVAVANEQPDTVGAFDDNNYEGFNLAP